MNKTEKAIQELIKDFIELNSNFKYLKENLKDKNIVTEEECELKLLKLETKIIDLEKRINNLELLKTKTIKFIRIITIIILSIILYKFGLDIKFIIQTLLKYIGGI
ncbi:MAG: hypothetical protein ACTSQY_00970 [Candidatus Odinarchaeia archaeon]